MNGMCGCPNDSLSLLSQQTVRWCASSAELHHVLGPPSDYEGPGQIVSESLLLCPLSIPWERMIPRVAVWDNYVQKTSHSVPVKSRDTPCSRSPLRKLDCHVKIQWLPNYTSLSVKELFKENEIQNTLSKFVPWIVFHFRGYQTVRWIFLYFTFLMAKNSTMHDLKATFKMV